MWDWTESPIFRRQHRAGHVVEVCRCSPLTRSRNHRVLNTLSSRFMFMSSWDSEGIVQKLGEGDFRPTWERWLPRQQDGKEFAQGHQWISAIWTQNCTSKTLSLLHFLWLVLLEYYCIFRWSANAVQMQTLIQQIWEGEGCDSAFPKTPKRFGCCWATDPSWKSESL